MLNASNAVENQKVSICRLSQESRALIIKALDIAWSHAAKEDKLIPLANELNRLELQLKESKEIWLIES